MTDINALDYFPEDTPAHMKPAWVGALFFAMQDNKIINCGRIRRKKRGEK